MVTQFDVKAGERTLHAYVTGDGSTYQLTVFWHHGTPNIGAPPQPLFEISEQLGIRWVSYDRPGYGGSSRNPGRSIASAADDVGVVADHLGIERFAVMGHSGGGPHALACAALMPDRVVAVVSAAGLAPFDAEGLDWFAGMARSGVQSLKAAAAGRDEKERFEASGFEYDPEFVPADLEALATEWSWLNEVVRPAIHNGPGPLIDDDIAYVDEWGFAVHQVLAPALFIHGVKDRIVPSSHGTWLAGRCPNSELRLFPDDGHVSVLRHAEDALRWLRNQAH